MSTAVRLACRVCHRHAPDVRLEICPVCHARTCIEHSFRRSGKRFCSKDCALWFFHSEDDDQEGTPEE